MLPPKMGLGVSATSSGGLKALTSAAVSARTLTDRREALAGRGRAHDTCARALEATPTLDPRAERLHRAIAQGVSVLLA